jgi:stearoyl-CoA desaturase (delta-9 desaturase)
MHVMCLAVIWVGWSWPAVAVAGLLYALRVFALTGFYHRYFSHRAFKTSRFCQFLFGALACSAVQRGPLWWAAHHRHHHAHSDDEEDLHSPRQHGFWWSHFCWFLTPKALPTKLKLIPDFAKYPELRFLDRFELLVPFLLAGCLFALGAGLDYLWPELGTGGVQMLIWGFFISTVAVYHVTYLVNSATHVFGRRRYQTKDDSRNNLWIALLTFGEGWHNNHHHYPNSARQGFFWWEVDITYYCLRLLSWLRLVWDLRPVPAHMLNPNNSALAGQETQSSVPPSLAASATTTAPIPTS